MEMCCPSLLGCTCPLAASSCPVSTRFEGARIHLACSCSWPLCSGDLMVYFCITGISRFSRNSICAHYDRSISLHYTHLYELHGWGTKKGRGGNRDHVVTDLRDEFFLSSSRLSQLKRNFHIRSTENSYERNQNNNNNFHHKLINTISTGSTLGTSYNQ